MTRTRKDIYAYMSNLMETIFLTSYFSIFESWNSFDHLFYHGCSSESTWKTKKSIQISLVFAQNSQSSSVHHWFFLVISLDKCHPLMLRFARICQWTPMGRDQVSFWKRQLCTCCGLKSGITLGWRHPPVGDSHPYETLISSQDKLSLFFCKSLLLCLWEFHSDPNVAAIFTG